MLREYPILYGYIGFVLFASCGRVLVVAVYGIASPHYYYAFHLPNVLMPAFHLWILWDVCRRVTEFSKPHPRTVWPTVILSTAAVPIVWDVLSMQPADFFYSFHAITLPLQVVACLSVCWKVRSCRQVKLGRNLQGMLVGVSLIVALQAVSFTRFLFVESPYEVLRFFLQFNYVLALVAFCYYLWEYEPLHQLDHSLQVKQRMVNERLRRVLKLILLAR